MIKMLQITEIVYCRFYEQNFLEYVFSKNDLFYFIL